MQFWQEKKLFESLDLSVDIKTVLLMAEDLFCYLHSLVTASAACCKRIKDAVRDRKIEMKSKVRGTTPYNLL